MVNVHLHYQLLGFLLFEKIEVPYMESAFLEPQQALMRNFQVMKITL